MPLLPTLPTVNSRPLSERAGTSLELDSTGEMGERGPALPLPLPLLRAALARARMFSVESLLAAFLSEPLRLCFRGVLGGPGRVAVVVATLLASIARAAYDSCRASPA